MARAVARLRATVWGELLAEFLGTFVLIAFGDAVVALNQSGRGTEIFMASGDWLLIAWGWALAVAFGVYVAGGVSGAHINPAVTLALAVKRAFPWPKVVPYWAAQVLGAFVGGALVYLVYHDAISSFEAAKHITRVRLRPVRGRRPARPGGAAGAGRGRLGRDCGGAADRHRRQGRDARALAAPITGPRTGSRRPGAGRPGWACAR